MTTYQRTKELFKTNPEAAYKMYLSDPNANGVDYQTFVNFMNRKLQGKQ